MSVAEARAEVWQSTNAEYHGCREYIGNSSLSLLAEDPLKFHLWESGQWQRPETEALRKGSGVDCLLSGNFESDCAIEPPGPFQSKEAKTAKALFHAANRGKTILKHAEYQECLEMSEAIRADSAARALLDAPGQWQYSVRWTDKRTGQGLKVRFDHLLTYPGDVIEVKTRRRPLKGRDHAEQWTIDMEEFGYYRQAALYSVARNRLGLTGSHFFITVYNEPPHEVFVYETDRSWLGLGRLHVRQLLDDLARRRKDSDWLPRGSGKINLCIAPEWALNKESIV